MTVTAVRTPEVGPDAGVRAVVRALDLLALLDDERPWSIADLTRASGELGYQPKVSLGEGLRRFAEWFREFGHLYKLPGADAKAC